MCMAQKVPRSCDCSVYCDYRHTMLFFKNSSNLLTAQRASPNESSVLKIAGGWRREGGCSGRNQIIVRDSSANTKRSLQREWELLTSESGVQ